MTVLSELSALFSGVGIQLSQSQVAQFSLYHSELLTWNRRVNLISRKDEERIVERHFIESARLMQVDEIQAAHEIIDIGSGAGFPGLPLKIVRPQILLTLLDSKRMKSLFLRDMIDKLALQDVEVVCARAEDVCSDPRWFGRFDCVVSRAVARLLPLYDMAEGFLKAGGVVVALKGSRADDEVEELIAGKTEIDVAVREFPGSNQALRLVVIARKPFHE